MPLRSGILPAMLAPLPEVPPGKVAGESGIRGLELPGFPR